MADIVQEASNKIIADSYLEYGKYVNSQRAIPSIFDGFKPVYRRITQTTFECFKDFAKTADIIGQNMSRHHPHGDASVKEVVSNLVKMGILEGQGNFGYKHIDGDVQEAAATRYTEARMNPTIRDQLSRVAPYVPTHFSYSGYNEWDYVPTPIPFSLISGTLGIAVGIGTRIPPFTMKSLLKAYRADNPDLLEFNYGYELTDRFGLRNLWQDGKGRVDLKFKVEESWEDQYGWTISGYPEIFSINMTTLNQWRSEGKIIVRDESDIVPKLFVSRVKRIRSITDEIIKEELDNITRRSFGYIIRVAYGDVVKTIGIRDWISLTYNNYLNLISQYKIDNAQKLSKQSIMWSNFNAIAELLLKRMPNDQVAAQLNLPVEIVDMVGRKQINTLQTADPDNELKKIETGINYYNSINPEDMITEFVEVGFNGSNLEN